LSHRDWNRIDYRRSTADKVYDHAELRTWIRRRGIRVRIARKGIETSEKLGQHRWVIERTILWLTDYRRLTIRHERSVSHFLAFLTLAAAMVCFKILQQPPHETWS
jgi:transposase